MFFIFLRRCLETVYCRPCCRNQFMIGLSKGVNKNDRAFSFTQHRSKSHNGTFVKTVDAVAKYMVTLPAKNIVVMAGAGISTPCGIPDFRSPGSGLYHNLQKYSLPYPEAIFDLDYFCMNSHPFFTLAKELYPGNFKPSLAHYFVKLLHEKGLLLRIYTQNIDGMERLAGIPDEQLVEAHGSFSTATCMKCGNSYSGDDIKDKIFAGSIPHCTKEHCEGVIKPDIVFFGEQLPMKFWLHTTDMERADLLIVMGTSLVVEPFASIAELVSRRVPRLLVNIEEVGTIGYRENDVILKSDVVEGVELLLSKLDWREDMNQLMKSSVK